MIENVDLDLLEKTYQNATIGLIAIEEVLDQTNDRDLSQDLLNQKIDYEELVNKSTEQLLKYGADVKEKSLFDRTITQMTKLLNDYQNADGKCIQIAKEFIKKEEKNIKVMKNYL